MFAQYGLALLIAALNLLFLVLVATRRITLKQGLSWCMAQLPGLAAVAAVYVLSLRGQLLQSEPTTNGPRTTAIRYCGCWIIPWRSSSSRFRCRFCSGRCAWSGWFSRFPGAVNGSLLLVTLVVGASSGLWGRYPYDGMRQSIYLLPMFYVLAGIGLHEVSRHTWRLVLVFAAVTLVWGGRGNDRTEGNRT